MLTTARMETPGKGSHEADSNQFGFESELKMDMATQDSQKRTKDIERASRVGIKFIAAQL